MSDPPSASPPASGPSEVQLALFRAVEDVHDLTRAVTVLVVDADGVSLAVSGDENDIPAPIRAALSGKKLAAAGSVRELLSSAGEVEPTLNVSVFDIDGKHLLAIIFDSGADLLGVQEVGREAKDLLKELLIGPS